MWESAPDGHLALSNIIKTLHENIIKHHCYLHFMWELEGSSRWKVESPDQNIIKTSSKHYQNIIKTLSKHYQNSSKHHQNIIKHYQTLSNIIIKHAKLESVELELRATKLSKGISETYRFLEGGEQGGKR